MDTRPDCIVQFVKREREKKLFFSITRDGCRVLQQTVNKANIGKSNAAFGTIPKQKNATSSSHTGPMNRNPPRRNERREG